MRKFKEYIDYLEYNKIEELPVIARIGYDEVVSLAEDKVEGLKFNKLLATHMIAIQSNESIKETHIDLDLYDNGIEVIKAYLADFLLKSEDMDLDCINLLLNNTPLISKLKEIGDAKEVTECCALIANNLAFNDLGDLDEIRIVDLLESPDFKPVVYKLGGIIQDVYEKTYVNVFSIDSFKEEFNSNPNFYSLYIKEFIVRTNVNNIKLNMGVSRAHEKLLKLFNVKGVCTKTFPIPNGFDFNSDMHNLFDINKEVLTSLNIITYAGLNNYFSSKILGNKATLNYKTEVMDILLGECLRISLSLRNFYSKDVYETILREF
ncbi:hypothetical protein [Paraclostridium bifermentans]|uniref:hypothetical protein n=1 Tax=Paraclostridium bifermentans TaxID=1490 RepID=UPI00374F09A3